MQEFKHLEVGRCFDIFTDVYRRVQSGSGWIQGLLGLGGGLLCVGEEDIEEIHIVKCNPI